MDRLDLLTQVSLLNGVRPDSPGNPAVNDAAIPLHKPVTDWFSGMSEASLNELPQLHFHELAATADTTSINARVDRILSFLQW